MFPPLAEHHRRYLNNSAITDEIIDKLGIGSNEALDCIVFPWTNGEQTILVRRPDNPQGQGKYIWPPGNPNILWKLRDGNGPILIIEGIKQSLAVASWADEQYEIYAMNGCWGWRNKRSPTGTVNLNFVEGRDVYVSFDADRNTNSQVKSASKNFKEVLLNRGATHVYFVNWPGTGDEGPDDLLAVISAGNRKEWLDKYIGAAVPNLAHPTESRRRVEIASAAFDKPRKRLWLWENRIPLGRFVLLAGYEGTAKSTLATHILSKATRGLLEGHFALTPKSVIYITAEEDWYEDVVPRLIANNADLTRVHRVFVRRGSGEEDSISLSADATELGTLIKEHDVSLIVLDSLLYFIGDGTNIDKATPINDILLPIIRIGMETKCTFLGILHFNKSNNMSNVLDKIANSKAFARLARSVLLTAKHEDHFILSTEKVLPTDSLKFRLENTVLPSEYDDPDYGPISAPVVVFEGAADLDVNDIVAARSRNKQPEEVSESVAWLREFMEMSLGEAAVKVILESGRREGFTADTLNVAKKKLKLKSKRVKGLGSEGYWVWKYDDEEIATIKQRKKEELGI